MGEAQRTLFTAESSWEYDCMASFVRGHNWQWVFRADQSVYDLIGHKLGNIYWEEEHLHVAAKPNLNEDYWPGGSFDGRDLVFTNRSGIEIGRCIPVNDALPEPPYPSTDSDSMAFFECEFHGDLIYYTFHADGTITSQYGVPQGGGSYSHDTENSIFFNHISWKIYNDNYDEIFMRGENHDRFSDDPAVRETCNKLSGSLLNYKGVDWDPVNGL